MCRARRCVDLGLLPLSVGVVMFLTIFICYTIAVLEHHVDPLLPAISDTGIKKPEEYIFSQLINLACALAVATLLLRYKMVVSMLADDVILRRYGLICCVVGVLGAIGLTLVANFPDDHAPSVHFTGAGMVFGLGTLYQVLDSILSFKMHPTHNGKCIVIVRTLLAVISTLALLTILTATTVFRLQGGKQLHKEDLLHWKPGQPGHAAFLVSNFAEWTLGFSFNCYFFTYIGEFQNYASHLHVRNLLCRSEQTASNDEVIKDQVQTPELHPSNVSTESHTHRPADERTALLSSESRPVYV